MMELKLSSPLCGLTLKSPVRVAKWRDKLSSEPVEWVDAVAKWDTGADHTSITSSLCRKLGLRIMGQIPVTSMTGTIQAMLSVVLVDLWLNGTFIPTWVVVVDVAPGGDFDVLIGMDIITKGDLLISTDYAEGSINFTFTPYKGTLKNFF